MPTERAVSETRPPSSRLGNWQSELAGSRSSGIVGPEHLLLVEDDPADVKTLRGILAETLPAEFTVLHAGSLSEAKAILASGGVQVILLDLGLPDCSGLQALQQTRAAAPEAPIVVITATQDENLGLEAIRNGAQDYLLKQELAPALLRRALRYAVERRRLEKLCSLVLIDDLTGLHNRRGFFSLGEQQLKLAYRCRRGLSLAFFDLDGLKLINDTFGHDVGSRALVEAAEVLQMSFRASDILGRLGGDEFAVLVVGATEESVEVLTSRVSQHLRSRNEHGDRDFRLSMSMGVAFYDPRQPCRLDELMARADQRMYEAKRGGLDSAEKTQLTSAPLTSRGHAGH